MSIFLSCEAPELLSTFLFEAVLYDSKFVYIPIDKLVLHVVYDLARMRSVRLAVFFVGRHLHCTQRANERDLSLSSLLASLLTSHLFAVDLLHFIFIEYHVFGQPLSLPLRRNSLEVSLADRAVLVWAIKVTADIIDSAQFHWHLNIEQADWRRVSLKLHYVSLDNSLELLDQPRLLLL